MYGDDVDDENVDTNLECDGTTCFFVLDILTIGFTKFMELF